jgi:hypothetical protein
LFAIEEIKIAEAKEVMIRVIANGRRALNVFFGGLMRTPNY